MEEVKPSLTMVQWRLHRPPQVAPCTTPNLRLWSLEGLLPAYGRQYVTCAIVRADEVLQTVETRTAHFALGSPYAQPPEKRTGTPAQWFAKAWIDLLSAAAANKELGL